MQRPSWDDYFASIAETVATRADCRRKKAGAVIVDKEHRILSTGYNGAPPNKPGCLIGACPRGLLSYEELAAFSSYDNCISVHAEQNALLYARVSLVGATIYCTYKPCATCVKLIAAAGIVRTIFPLEETNGQGTSNQEGVVPADDNGSGPRIRTGFEHTR